VTSSWFFLSTLSIGKLTLPQLSRKFQAFKKSKTSFPGSQKLVIVSFPNQINPFNVTNIFRTWN